MIQERIIAKGPSIVVLSAAIELYRESVATIPSHNPRKAIPTSERQGHASKAQNVTMQFMSAVESFGGKFPTKTTPIHSFEKDYEDNTRTHIVYRKNRGGFLSITETFDPQSSKGKSKKTTKVLEPEEIWEHKDRIFLSLSSLVNDQIQK